MLLFGGDAERFRGDPRISVRNLHGEGACSGAGWRSGDHAGARRQCQSSGQAPHCDGPRVRRCSARGSECRVVGNVLRAVQQRRGRD